MKDIETNFDQFKSLCNLSYSRYCSFLQADSDAHLKNMKKQHLKLNLFYPVSKVKRALPLIGLGILFIINLSTAAALTVAVHKTNTELKRVHAHNLKNTILIEETLRFHGNSTSKVYSLMSELEDKIYVNLKNLDEQHVNDQLDQLFHLAHYMLKSTIINQTDFAKNVWNELKNTLTGQLVELIPENILYYSLLHIEQNLKKSQTLPLDLQLDSSIQISKSATIAGALFDQKIFVEIKFPIPEKEIFNVNEIIPIPIKHGNNMVVIEPRVDFLLLDQSEIKYISMRKDEYFDAKFDSAEQRIFSPFRNEDTDYTKECEINLLKNPNKDVIRFLCDFKNISFTNHFDRINSDNTFYATIVSPINATVNCKNQQPEFFVFNMSGILTIDQECEVDTNSVYLRPKTNYEVQTKSIFTIEPSANNVIIDIIFGKINDTNNNNIQVLDTNKTIIMGSMPTNTELLNEVMKTIQENNRTLDLIDLSSFSFDSFVNFINRWFVLVCLFLIFLVIIILCFFYFFRNNNSTKNTTNEPNMIFLQNINSLK